MTATTRAAGTSFTDAERNAAVVEMVRLRELDRALVNLVKSKADAAFSGTVLHPYSGLEVIAAGVAAARRPGDIMFATHRGLGHCLAWAPDRHRMLAETLGRSTGPGKGRAGHMHIVDPDAGVGGTNGIVGGGTPLAVGTAYAQLVRGTRAVTVAFVGDGAVNTGAFHESLNMATVMRLPLVIVCEDNGLTEGMASAGQLAAKNVTARAAAYEIPAEEVSGDDLDGVHIAATAAIDHAASGLGPAFLNCTVSRPAGHYVGDGQHYRDAKDVARSAQNHPVDRALDRLGRSAGELEQLRRTAESYVADLLAAALADPEPDLTLLRQDGDDVPGGLT